MRTLAAGVELWCSHDEAVWPALPGGRTLAAGDGRSLLLVDGARTTQLLPGVVLLGAGTSFSSGRLVGGGRIVRLWLADPSCEPARATIADPALALALAKLARSGPGSTSLAKVFALLEFAAPRPLPAPVLPASLRLALRHIVAHGHRSVPLDEAAAAAHASKFHLSRLARRFLGASLHDVAVRLRTAAALRALRGGQPLRDVAAATGFADQPHLTRVFRRELGLTPGQFARLHPRPSSPNIRASSRRERAPVFV